MTGPNDPEALLTPKEAADRLRVSEFTLLDWLRAGTIRGRKVGGGVKGRWRVRVGDIETRLPGRIADNEVHYIVGTLLDILPGATMEELVALVTGAEKPAFTFWRNLAEGIRALQAGDQTRAVQPKQR
jgi:excisionase family DNA binding protein